MLKSFNGSKSMIILKPNRCMKNFVCLNNIYVAWAYKLRKFELYGSMYIMLEVTKWFLFKKKSGAMFSGVQMGVYKNILYSLRSQDFEA